MTLAKRIAEKAREEFGYTTFNGLRMIGITEEKLAALIAAELEERDREARKAFDDLIDVAYKICRYERFPPEDGSRLNPGDLLMLYLPKAKEALALLEGGGDATTD